MSINIVNSWLLPEFADWEKMKMRVKQAIESDFSFLKSNLTISNYTKVVCVCNNIIKYLYIYILKETITNTCRLPIAYFNSIILWHVCLFLSPIFHFKCLTCSSSIDNNRFTLLSSTVSSTPVKTNHVSSSCFLIFVDLTKIQTKDNVYVWWQSVISHF